MKLLTKLTIFSLLLFALSCIFFANTTAYAAGDIKEVDTVPTRNYTVVIDAGHGGTDPGSIGYKSKVHEADLNLKLAKMLQKKTWTCWN